MFIKSKVVRLVTIVFGVLFFLLLMFFIFKKPTLGQKMTIDYVNSHNFEIKNCRRECGYSQKLMGAYDNVSYFMNFPIFDNRKWNGVVFNEVSDKIYCYRKSRIDPSIINDKFELFSNYQTFKFGGNDENVSIQMQFYEKNLTKKKSVEFIKTFVFYGDELVDENKFFKRSGYSKIIDEIRKAFVAEYPGQKGINLDEVLPYSLKTLHNFVVTDDSVIFFYGRGKLLPKRIASIKVDKSKIKDHIRHKKVSNIDKSKPMVALTFDDGPDGEKTDELLEILNENGAKATFFVVGKQAEKHADLLNKIIDYGCEIGNHTYSHTNLNSLNERQLNYEIGKNNEIVEKLTGGYRMSLMRPPYGNCNNRVRDNLNQAIILWSLDTADWKHKNSAKTIEMVMNHVSDGAIVLMHDVHKESIEAAKVIIPKLIEKGYVLVTVSELAASKGKSLDLHTKYFRIHGS